MQNQAERRPRGSGAFWPSQLRCSAGGLRDNRRKEPQMLGPRPRRQGTQRFLLATYGLVRQKYLGSTEQLFGCRTKLNAGHEASTLVIFIALPLRPPAKLQSSAGQNAPQVIERSRNAAPAAAARCTKKKPFNGTLLYACTTALPAKPYPLRLCGSYRCHPPPADLTNPRRIFAFKHRYLFTNL